MLCYSSMNLPTQMLFSLGVPALLLAYRVGERFGAKCFELVETLHLTVCGATPIFKAKFG